MKHKLSLSVDKPCSEKWEHFTPNSKGGFCGSCNKTVKDFTTMSDDEIFNFFKNKPLEQCGRFRPHQLKSYHLSSDVMANSRRNIVGAGLLSLLLLFVSKEGHTRDMTQKINRHIVENSPSTSADPSNPPTHTIKGLVKDEMGQELPGVTIQVKGTELGTITDSTGRFELAGVKDGDVLIISFIGYEVEEYVVRKDASPLIQLTVTMDLNIMGAVMVDHPYTEKKSFFGGWWQKVKSVF